MFRVITTSAILLSPLFSENVLTEFNKKVPYVIDLELSHTMLDRKISGNADKVESQVKDVTYGTISATLFPDTYDIELSYSQSLKQDLDSNLYNPFNHDDDAKHFSFSMIPYYHKTYGGVGIFYTKFEQNSQYKNKVDAPLGLYRYDQSTATPTVQQFVGTDKLVKDQSYQAKEKFSYLGLKYLLPEYKYLPKGTNIFYSKMDRDSVYYSTFANEDRLLHMSGDGRMFGIGLQRSIDELPENKFSLHLVQLSQGKFTDFPDIDLTEYTAGVTYKAKDWYLKVEGLVYTAESFSSDFGGSTLEVYEHRDISGSVHIGTSF